MAGDQMQLRHELAPMGEEQESVASNYRHLVQSSVGSPATLRRDKITLDGVDMFVQVKTVPVENDEEATSPNDATLSG